MRIIPLRCNGQSIAEGVRRGQAACGFESRCCRLLAGGEDSPMKATIIAAVVCVLECPLAFGQATPPATLEVASVRPSPPIPPEGRVYFGPPRGGPGTPDPGQITWSYATMRNLLMTAYDVKTYQISGPAWMAT